MDLYWCDLRRAGVGDMEALHHEAGRLLLRKAWRGRFGAGPMPPLTAGPNGKPAFPPGVPVQFSITHSGHIAACAFGFQPVGLDAERVEGEHRELFSFFRPEEQEWLAEGDSLRFYRLFTVKESYVKLTGEGLSALPALPAVIGPGGEMLPRLGGAAIFPLTLWLPDCSGALSMYRPEPVVPRAFDLRELIHINNKI
ncbi:MAG: 4'-phosphopantetheinyl transferase superfamily protein [Oscillospiraceae bacterium]|nr:4'-phosphopantetheinyl transferase superfamily protein [Oscillospiraceae bacterium]